MRSFSSDVVIYIIYFYNILFFTFLYLLIISGFPQGSNALHFLTEFYLAGGCVHGFHYRQRMQIVSLIPDDPASVLKAFLDRRLDIFSFRSAGMMSADGVGVVICNHNR